MAVPDERFEELAAENGRLRERLVAAESRLHEQGEALAELRSGELLATALAEETSDAFFLVDGAGRFLYANRAACDLSGYPTDELLGMSFTALLTEEELERDPPDLERIRGGARVTRERRIRRRGGEIIPIRVTARMLSDGRMLTIARDMSEQKQTQSTLGESQRTVRALLESSLDAFLILDARDGAIIEVNQTVADRFGASTPEQLRGRTVFDMFAPDVAQGRRAWAQEVLAQGKPIRTEDRDRGKVFDSTVYPVLDDAGKPTKLVVLSRDITNRKRAEEALRASEALYRSLVEASPEGIYLADIHTEALLMVNRQAATLHGFATPEEMLAEVGSCKDLFVPEQRPVTMRELERARQDVAQPLAEVELIRKDGTRFPAELTAAPVVDGDGLPNAFLMMARDVTFKRKLQESLLNTQKLESLGVLAGGIAHDFNNLLAAVLGNVTLAKALVNDNGPAQQRLAETETALARAHDLTQQLLTFSKGGAPVKAPLALDQLVRECAGFALRGSRAQARFHLPSDLWPVEADVGQVNQAIQNLLLNAAQAMPRGGTIDVSTENVVVADASPLGPAPGRYVRLCIRDRGMGIPAELLPRIFDPYFTTKPTGSGLGLAATRSVVDRHGGHIDVESALGEGTTFIVHLPASETAPPRAADVDEPPLGGTGRLLVMDDEAGVREVMSEILRYLGYDVEVAPDGDSAIELVRQRLAEGRPFDVAILDLTVPGGLGGKEALAELRTLDPSLRAIVSSGYNTDPVLSRFRDLGFQGVLRKPSSLQEVARTVRTVLEA